MTLTSAQLCYLDGSCKDKGVVNYRIEGDDKLILTDKFFTTAYESDKFILTYWGTDDNGNPVSVEQTVCVEKDSTMFDIGC